MKPTSTKSIFFDITFNWKSSKNVAKIFFHLLDKHFPKSGKPYKVFNRDAVKVSDTCMENVSQIIERRDKRVSKTKQRIHSTMSLQRQLNTNCRVENVGYKCYVSATGKSKVHVYIGVAKGG